MLNRQTLNAAGPTNSGKTYNALQSLAAAERGVYCAPLRLLAMEVYETLNHMGVFCDLVSARVWCRGPVLCCAVHTCFVQAILFFGLPCANNHERTRHWLALHHVTKHVDPSNHKTSHFKIPEPSGSH